MGINIPDAPVMGMGIGIDMGPMGMRVGMEMRQPNMAMERQKERMQYLRCLGLEMAGAATATGTFGTAAEFGADRVGAASPSTTAAITTLSSNISSSFSAAAAASAISPTNSPSSSTSSTTPTLSYLSVFPLCRQSGGVRQIGSTYPGAYPVAIMLSIQHTTFNLKFAISEIHTSNMAWITRL
jgi:hypothetical protein